MVSDHCQNSHSKCEKTDPKECILYDWGSRNEEGQERQIMKVDRHYSVGDGCVGTLVQYRDCGDSSVSIHCQRHHIILFMSRLFMSITFQ